MLDHFVQFYETDVHLANQVARFIRAGLLGGEATLVVATRAHREALEQQLRPDIVRAASATPHAERYLALDAEETLAKFMVDGAPHEGRFFDVIAPALRRAAAQGNGRV